jgi:SAM-dependent methyltransferase
MDTSGVDRGVCCVLGFDAEAALKLVRTGDFLIHLLDPDPEVVAQVRQMADQAGLDIDRVVAEQGGLDELPQADNIVDLLVATKITDDDLTRLHVDEVLRVLRPGGVAVVGSTVPDAVSDRFTDKLKKWADADSVESLTSPVKSVVVLRRQMPQGIDSWTHWEHGPDNNPVSEDQVIKAPYMTQFMAEPFYIGMPSITTAAGGRTFLATGHIAHHRREWDMINQLIARNGYNETSQTTPTRCSSMAR